MMEIDDNLIGLENLILNKELSAEEYFTIVVSTCENDLKIAKSAVANVLTFRLVTSHLKKIVDMSNQVKTL